MRRLLAIAMVFCFGYGLAAPLLAADLDSNLPQCCRRDGRHHCASGMESQTGARSVSTIAPKCPMCPKSTVAPGALTLADIQTSKTGTPLYAHPESRPQTEARYRVSFARSRQKRGPPRLL